MNFAVGRGIQNCKFYISTSKCYICRIHRVLCDHIIYASMHYPSIDCTHIFKHNQFLLHLCILYRESIDEQSNKHQNIDFFTFWYSSTGCSNWNGKCYYSRVLELLLIKGFLEIRCTFKDGDSNVGEVSML